MNQDILIMSYEDNPIAKITKPVEEISTSTNPTNEVENMKILICTWNVGNKEPETLETLLKHGAGDYDILCFGLQESTYPHATSTESIKYLEDKVKLVMGGEFHQMQMFLYAKNGLKDHIKDVECKYQNTGFLGFPNKGGICITMTVSGTSLAFVSCHLPAHEGVIKCEARNLSVRDILDGVRCKPDNRLDITAQYHHVFWMGDMNYRTTYDPAEPEKIKETTIQNLMGASKKKDKDKKDVAHEDDEEDPEEDHVGTQTEKSKKANEKRKQNEKVLTLVEGKKWKEILEHDELNREILAERALCGFTALQPNFAPTFKRIRNRNIKDILGKNLAEEAQELQESAYAQSNLSEVTAVENIPPKDEGVIATPESVASANFSAPPSLKHDSMQSFSASSLSPHKKSILCRSLNGDVVVTFDFSERKKFEYKCNTCQADIEVSFTDLSGGDFQSTCTTPSCTDEVTVQAPSPPPQHFYDEKRIPSFTDRILYRSMPAVKSDINNVFFESVEEMLTSDHKPVRALFTVVRRPEAAATLESVKKSLEKTNDSEALSRKKSAFPLSQKKTKIMKLVISNLKGQDLAELDLNGLSDPFCIVTTDPSILIKQSSSFFRQSSFRQVKGHEVVWKNLNPGWKEDILVPLDIPQNDKYKDALISLGAHVILSVWDKDTWNEDDLIGVAHISFEDIIDADPKKGFDFNVPIYNTALVKGHISGNIRIDEDVDESSTVKSGCNCTIQ